MSRYNLIGIGGGLTNGVNGHRVGITNPAFSPLGNDGGPTQTMLRLAASQVIDAGSNEMISAGITQGQRGLAGSHHGIVDMGADE